MPKKSDITIGLTGNPNVGKSTLFNTLTGSHQHVGNWPGKTVEKKEGIFSYGNKKIQLVDLPGSYSLTAYTEEETITSDFILDKKPDIIVQIIDAQNIERNLFMTLQLIELKAPLIIALNMMGGAENNGLIIDVQKLSTLLNAPVIPVNAKSKKSTVHLMDKIIKHLSSEKKHSKIDLTYGKEIDNVLGEISNLIKEEDPSVKNKKWTALKLIEGDIKAENILRKKSYYDKLSAQVNISIKKLRRVFGKEINTILANVRYGFIKGLSKEVIIRKKKKNNKLSEKFDDLVTNKYLGIPIFLLVAWLLFQVTFKISEPIMSLIEFLFEKLGGYLSSLFEAWQAPAWFTSLVVDGAIGGVGGILVFVPIIGILFLFIALLEDSGYMARVAYVMDKIMHRIGLHGKAFIPLILGFGCNVPAIMATRTLETRKDRLLTILINPFMSCGARLPVYVLFAGAFFVSHQGLVIFSLYLLGIVVAITMGLIFKKFLFKKLSSPFVIELPPYRRPAVKGLLIHAWERVWIFIKKAGTIILAFSIIIWLLASIPFGIDYGSRDSYAGKAGQAITPVFEPIGIDNWQSSVALIFGFVAKEVVVSTLGTLYNVDDVETEEGEATLRESLQNDFTPLSAYSFMVFVLLYVPCMATLSVIKRETNSLKWTVFIAAYMTTLAWLVAYAFFQGGKILGYS